MRLTAFYLRKPQWRSGDLPHNYLQGRPQYLHHEIIKEEGREIGLVTDYHEN
jgi:hypothetical protein